MDHVAFRELAAGAALDDLEPAERRELDTHLVGCETCRRLALELDDVVGELALVAPTMHAPAALRGQVLAALREPSRPTLSLVTGGAASSEAADLAGPSGVPMRSSGFGGVGASALRWTGRLAAAAVVVVVLGLGVQGRQLSDELASTRRSLADAQVALQARQAAVAVAADPSHVTIPLVAEPAAPAAHAVVMYRPGTTDAYLMATDLPPTPPGKVYQLWYADASGVHPLDTFAFDGAGPFVAPFGVDLASSAAAMVTLEPTGGAHGEPGPQVVFGEF
jgi:Anti-sigma-K factor rskA, C-terminal